MSYLARPKIIYVGKKQPYVCDVCKFVLRDLDDVKSVHNEGACTNCTMNFRYTNYSKWDSGWRPTVEEARSA
jgi:hypothetical protein